MVVQLAAGLVHLFEPAGGSIPSASCGWMFPLAQRTTIFFLVAKLRRRSLQWDLGRSRISLFNGGKIGTSDIIAYWTYPSMVSASRFAFLFSLRGAALHLVVSLYFFTLGFWLCGFLLLVLWRFDFLGFRSLRLPSFRLLTEVVLILARGLRFVVTF